MFTAKHERGGQWLMDCQGKIMVFCTIDALVDYLTEQGREKDWSVKQLQPSDYKRGRDRKRFRFVK